MMSSKEQKSPGLSDSGQGPTSPSIATFSSWLKRYRLALAVIGLLPILLYWQTTNFGYVLDDKIVITDNEYTQEGFGGIWDILTTESFQGYFGERKNLVQGNRYRPLSIITFAVEVGLWGSEPGLSHAINILLYMITGWLLFRILLQLWPPGKEQRWYSSVAIAATLLYLAHPIHSEAVANIKGRDEIMAMLLSLASLWVAIKYHYRASASLLVGLAAVFFLGLLAKENTITFWAVIPLTLWFFLQTEKDRLLRIVGSLSLATAAYLALRFTTAGVPDFSQEITDVMNNPFFGMNGSEKSATIFYTFAKYLQLLLVPYPLSHDYYPYAIPKVSWDNWVSILALLVYVGGGLWALWNIRYRKIAAYCILYYLLTFSIVSNVVINVGTFMNERFVYMASLGFTLYLAYLLLDKVPKIWATKGRAVGIAITVTLIAIYSAITIDRVPAWSSALALNTSAVQVSSGSARANSFMSTALFNDFMATSNKAAATSLLDQAEAYADQALLILPNYGNANTMRAGIAAERFKLDRKINPLLTRFEQVVMVRPGISFVGEFLNYLKSQGSYDGGLVKFYDRVGNRFVSEYKNLQWGIYYLEQGVQIDPTSSRLNQSLANAYQLAGKPQKAQEYLNRIR